MQYFTNKNKIWQHPPGACLLDSRHFFSLWFHMLYDGIICTNMECRVRLCRQAERNQFQFLLSPSYFCMYWGMYLPSYVAWFIILIQDCLCVNHSVSYEVGSKCFYTKLFYAVPFKVFLLWFDLASVINFTDFKYKIFYLKTHSNCALSVGLNFKSFCLTFSS
jgi:hypothetical protein